MSETPLLGLPVLEASQAQKHVTHNEALLLLDSTTQLSAISRTASAPPATPADGDRYLVALAPTGGWAGQAGKLAIRQSGGWLFRTPRKGWQIWVEDEARFLVFDGTVWKDLQAISELANMALLGVNTSADAGNRLAVSSPATLLNHAGSDHRLKINKQAAAATASLVLQDNYSGRAELGLAGDDDFRLKVSGDGSAWADAIVVDRSTGAVTLPNTPSTIPPGDKGDMTVSAGVWHFTRTNGSPGDGIADDAPYWNDLLAAGKTVVLSDRSSYVLKTPAVLSVAGTGIVAPHGATVKISMAAGAFDNDLHADRSSITTAGGKKYANPIHISNVAGVSIKGLRLSPTAWTDNRYLNIVACSESDDLELVDIEIFGFSRAFGIVLNDCDRASIRGHRIHDFWTNSTAAQSNAVGIIIDSDALVGSKFGKIGSGFIYGLTPSEACRAVNGWQSDGISMQGVPTKPTLGWEVTEQHIALVGEGVDCYGSDNIFAKNHLRRCFGAGFKFIYGASRNLFEGNTILDTGLAAFYAMGQSLYAWDCDGNKIASNIVKNYGITGDWPMCEMAQAATPGALAYDTAAHGGAKAWSASAQAAVRIDSGSAGVVTDLTIDNNDFDGGGTGDRGIYAEGGGITTNRVYLRPNNRLKGYVTAELTDSAGRITRENHAATNSLMGNNSGAGGLPVSLTATQARTLLNVAQAANGDANQDASNGLLQLLARDDMISGAWNGSFESGDFGWTKQTGGGVGWTIVNDAANARTGNWAALNSNVGSSSLDLISNIRKRCRPGDTVFAEAWIKSDAGAAFSTCQVRIFWYDKDGNAVSPSSGGTNYNTPQTSFAQATIAATAPANAASYSEGIRVAKSAGLIWADDVHSFRLRDAARLLLPATVTASLMGGDVTAAGKAMVTAADAAAQTALLSTATAALKGLLPAADKSKLDGIAAGATANSADAVLLARANHTGSQTAATISDFADAADLRADAAVAAHAALTDPHPQYLPRAWSSFTANLGDGFGVSDYETTITDAACTPSSFVELQLAATADTDENEPELVALTAMIARPSSGSFGLSLAFAERHSGSLKLQYRIN